MTAQEALNIVKQLLEPKSLNSIQEIIFLESWVGKLYREIALEAGYDLDYVKEVGSQLWSLLSEALEEKVTKKNIKLILGRNQLGGIPFQPAIQSSNRIEYPGGAVPLHSSIYIRHPLIEDRTNIEISQPGSLIRIKAARQTGKTSLIYRILAQAKRKGIQTAMLNLQIADSQLFRQLNKFLRWFCINISRQLYLEPKIDDFWDEEVGSKVSCTVYFQDYLLKELNNPLVLAIDDVDRVFEYPDLTQDFLSLLRTWYETAAEQLTWQKLRLVIAHSTEASMPIKPSQSPFNVGLPIQLLGFNRSQIYELMQRYELEQLDITLSDLEPLLALIGGHPYLLQLAFYHLKVEGLSLTNLLQQAPTQAGIYSGHLHRHWNSLRQQPELLEAFHHVITASRAVQLDAAIAHRLEGMGLIRLTGNEVRPSCDLYQQYFRSQLANLQLAEIQNE
ncbi:AAA-like domain-containing protein [Oscillatoria sp. FACHB-1407]|uniref:AAA-like domain-containing protein n=1 Tax=Oscillatoria sp. FACHB-1407 TaxID=2692847 RepID=UPI001685ED3A|nr:AAA-like domain-containing protein [Oscillatoria sp. FACHB-1407]MBD2459808.1 AAA-like domain-containing protein [Oscillatoria sp. FACHB-1407]